MLPDTLHCCQEFCKNSPTVVLMELPPVICILLQCLEAHHPASRPDDHKREAHADADVLPWLICVSQHSGSNSQHPAPWPGGLQDMSHVSADGAG